MFLAKVCHHVSDSVNDTICFDILGEIGQMKYGRQRVWGSIGISFLIFVSGCAIDLWSQGKVYKTYTPVFILLFVFICSDLFYCWRKLKLPLSKSPNILKSVCAILKLIPIVIFLCTAISAGIFEGLIFNFLFWYIEDLAMATGYMGQVKIIEGVTTLTSFFGSKVIFFFMSGELLKKFGYGYTLTFCFLCYALRLALLSVVSIPWFVVLVEVILEGPSFALLYATIVTYASIISPPGTSATIQGIAAGVKNSIGYAIGSFSAGFLFKEVGSRMTLKIYSGLAAFFALVYIIVYTLYLKHMTLSSVTQNNVKWKRPNDAQREL
ncbi:Major facilitator superfamily domain-containing protein 6 [Cyphomyrmex costatus]|uniref:Major facilitator superfamily domain-containing protein 6 n=2 Tax=Cyphomyrmex costatus TaxID=456900 RepID=A0A151IM15_9HYME|nr:Major facilitator superfamily domain-containing protein 6 [Cyphomyrmex costatus]